MLFDMVKSLAERIATMLGLNLNGLITGIAFALIFMWMNNEQKRNQRGRQPPQQPSEASSMPGGISASHAAKEEMPKGDLNEAEHKAQIDKLLSRAQHHRGVMSDEKLTVEHLVLALAENQRFTEILQCAEGLSEDQMKAAIKKSRMIFNRGTNNEEIVQEVQTNISKYSRDLSALAKQGKLDPVIGRNDELRRLINVLSRRTKNNPIILGDPGIGKTALVDGLAQRIADGDVPDVLRECTVSSLDMGMLMAGAMMPGEFEERLKGVLKELTEVPGKFILFIDDIHTVTGPNAQQGGGMMDASVLLKPLLSRGELRCIGATTLDKFRKFIEKDPALERRFQQVPIDPPTVAQTISILRGLRISYERHHNVKVSDKAIVAAATLADRYVPDRHLPDKAIDLMDEATARVKMDKTLRPELLDKTERRIRDLEAERRMLRRGTTLNEERGDNDALEAVEAELKELRAKRDEMDGYYRRDIGEAGRLSGLQEEIDKLDEEIDEAEAGGNEALADELRATKRAALIDKITAERKKVFEKHQKSQSGKPFVPVLGGRGEVSESDIAGVISNWTGIPLTKLVESERDKLLLLTDELHKRIIGQHEAVDAVAEAIHRSRAGMKDPNGPIASFLFLGPTGVGKTELAKALASYLFNSEEAMVRLDMSEYMEKHAVSKLIGAPPGYVGFDEGGQLTEQVRRKPYTVVLFDEVEKAHVDVFNLLLQILDDGRVTDSQGRVVSFKNAIIIMTSNLGSAEIYRESAESARTGDAASAPKPGQKGMKELVMDQVRKHFKPEFVNRIDEFIIFEPLKRNEIAKIVRLRLKGVISRLGERKMKLVLRDSAVDYLAAKGFDPVFGARPVKRVIQRELETVLARSILKGDFQEGDSVLVSVKVGEEAMSFHRVPHGGQLPPLEDIEVKENGASVPPVVNGSAEPMQEIPSAAPRALKFDPLKRMSKAQQNGEDLSKDGSLARNDPSSLPPSAN